MLVAALSIKHRHQRLKLLLRPVQYADYCCHCSYTTNTFIDISMFLLVLCKVGLLDWAEATEDGELFDLAAAAATC